MPDQQGFARQLMGDPAVKALLSQLQEVAVAKATSAISEGAKNMTASKGGQAMSDMSDSIAEGDAPGTTAAKGIWGAIKGKLGIGAAKRPTNITDEFWIGMPVTEVYNQWIQWEKLAGFSKGIEQVTQDDDHVTSDWKAKIFLNKRSWKATVIEQVPDQRVKWKTEGAKGTIDGVLTFHEINERLTLVMYVLEYRPKGFFEWWGNRWRTVGRRARLDMKHFKRYLMMAGAADPDAWRGSVSDGEVVEDAEPMEPVEPEDEAPESEEK